MKVLVVFNQPYEGSYSAAILEGIQTSLADCSHELDLIHLDRDDFDPVMHGTDLRAIAA
ncbi:hypothetical protein [Thioclava sp. GXIMD4215]|uniref:hypothetical protein n=1 Tax=Thioclava sp. GXIMD4215 TaxID=3131928 RepID=UPI003251119A